MKNNIINYGFIFIGACITIYFGAKNIQNSFVLLLGLLILVIGIYRLSKSIPSNNTDNSSETNYLDEEVEDKR